ncbi:VCBS domain-containing protein [Salinigranum halophilum]|uniref:VCBS domain-containing protein n=1 Tax=Salinigranum halophilum TaxID=2565931 RepID=UPI0010A791CD|nr:VCBS domain-containing protein [Salinigranum halophilum]
MIRITHAVLMAGLVLVATTAVGASAFTSASIDREANANVVADQNGLLSLTDGNSGDLIFEDGTGQLAMDLTAGSAKGANTDALFVFGDRQSPSTTQAFTITNNDATTHDITVSYDGTDDNSAANLQFEIYDAEGSSVGTVDEEGTTATISAPASATYYVVVVLDTGHGEAGVLQEDTDLSGTLSFTIDDEN